MTNHPNRNRTARAERIVDVVLAEFGQVVIRKISMRDAMVAACAAALIDREGHQTPAEDAFALGPDVGDTHNAEAVIREPGWYWVRRVDDAAADDEYGHIMHWSGHAWRNSSIEENIHPIQEWVAGPLVNPPDTDREGHQTPCLSALASGEACQPNSFKRCAICGFVVDTKFAASTPTVRMRP